MTHDLIHQYRERLKSVTSIADPALRLLVLASLRRLMRHDFAQRRQAIAWFYEQWRKEALE